VFAGERVKQGDVRVEVIALRRKVERAPAGEFTVQFGIEFQGENKWVHSGVIEAFVPE
jgi:hypothetical protein